MKFAYVIQNDRTDKLMRVEVEKVVDYTEHTGWKESTFPLWWGAALSDETKALWQEGAVSGTFNDPEYGVLSLENGEPIEEPSKI